ncbi:MAG: DUF3352 domain-containing protein, partial [Planctomycetota bacterium]
MHLPRTIRRAILVPIVMIATIIGSDADANERANPATTMMPPVPRLLPGDTLALVNIRNANDLRRDFAKSSVGEMFDDPRLRPFVSDFYQTVATLFDEFAQSIGLTFDELLAIPQGSLAIALIPGAVPQDDDESPLLNSELTDKEIAREARKRRERANSFAAVLIVDAGDRAKDVSELLDRLAMAITDGGAIEVKDTPPGVRQFVKARGRQQNGSDQVLEWFRRENWFVIGNDRDTASSIRQIIDESQTSQSSPPSTNIADSKADQRPQSRSELISEIGSLAEHASFSSVMIRSLGAEMEEPGITFFIDPANLAKRLIRRGGQSFFVMPIVRDLGLSKIRGVGGGLFRGGDIYDGISHLHVVIDPPRDGFFGVLRPEPVSLSPPSWVPTEISSYNAFGWDIETTFNNIGKIVSRFGGEGQFEKFIDRSFQRPFDWDIREVLISKVT